MPPETRPAILLIESTRTGRETMTTIFQRQGWNVFPVATPEKAMDLLSENATAFDFVVAEYLPDISDISTNIREFEAMMHGALNTPLSENPVMTLVKEYGHNDHGYSEQA